ncbi:MAG: response regulator, partial [Lachnospiraceae bacterium]|nr:response regulator [Lachnospiraceae bacterium]
MKKSVLVIDNDMDTQLPECNGCEVLKVMRQTKAVPILVLSAKVDVVKRTEILKAGANVYL